MVRKNTGVTALILESMLFLINMVLPSQAIPSAAHGSNNQNSPTNNQANNQANGLVNDPARDLSPMIADPLRKPKRIPPKRTPRISSSKDALREGLSFMLFFAVVWGVFLIASDPSFAIQVEELKVPIKGLKDEMFGGWMFAVKIAACVSGAVVSVFKQSLAPMGVGGGIGAGIHFFDKWIGDGAGMVV